MAPQTSSYPSAIPKLATKLSFKATHRVAKTVEVLTDRLVLGIKPEEAMTQLLRVAAPLRVFQAHNTELMALTYQSVERCQPLIQKLQAKFEALRKREQGLEEESSDTEYDADTE